MQVINQKVKKTLFSKLFSFWEYLFKIKLMQVPNQTYVNRLTPALAGNKNSLQH